MGESARYSGTMRGPSRPLNLLAALICLASPLTAVNAGEIYKSVDAQGHVVYSDHADSSAQKTDVQVDLPDAAEVARRIFQRDADGNRIYYTDADADARRENARQTMLAVCE